MENNEAISALFAQWKGAAPQSIEPLAGAGSNRRYYRLTDGEGHTVIAVEGTSVEENAAFVGLARHFEAAHLPVPHVYAVSGDGLCYLQSDLGRRSLYDALAQGRANGGQYSAEEIELLRRTIRLLPRIQVEGARGLDFSICYPQAEMDATCALFDLNYFKYCFLKATGVDFHELRLATDFRALAEELTAEKSHTFLYRDFQARNIMLTDDGQPLLIDFQGGRRGPIYYDLASFLWQASAHYSDVLRRTLIDEYYEAAKPFGVVPERKTFDERLQLFVFFRTLQVLGAYGFRGYFERKAHFLASIPPAIANLRVLLGTQKAKLSSLFPHLYEVLCRMVELPQFVPVKAVEGRLVVRITSFSYKKGIPDDPTGNGGGYVFDCRSTHNPGRYEQYKQLTGRDEAVIKFLEDDGEITAFLENVYHLADFHTRRYLDRGFTSLMFSFGCTGGQHRSVYSAQHLAEHLWRKFGSENIEIRLCHRERGLTQTFCR